MDIDGVGTTGSLTANQRRRMRRCTSLVPRRVLLSEATDEGEEDEPCGGGEADEDNTGTDLAQVNDLSANTNTLSMSSAVGSTVSALLSAYRSRDGPLSQIISEPNSSVSSIVSSSNTHYSTTNNSKSSISTAGNSMAGCPDKENRLSDLYSLLSTPLHHQPRQPRLPDHQPRQPDHQPRQPDHQPRQSDYLQRRVSLQSALGRTPRTATSAASASQRLSTPAGAAMPSGGGGGVYGRLLAGSASCSRLQRVDEYGRTRPVPAAAVAAVTAGGGDTRPLARTSHSCSQLPHHPAAAAAVPPVLLSADHRFQQAVQPAELPEKEVPPDTSATCRSAASDSATLAAADELGSVRGRPSTAAAYALPHTQLRADSIERGRMGRLIALQHEAPAVPTGDCLGSGAGSGFHGEQKTPSTSGTAVSSSMYPTPPSDTSLSSIAVSTAARLPGETNSTHHRNHHSHMSPRADAATQTDPCEVSLPPPPPPALAESGLAALCSGSRPLTSVSVGDRQVALLGQIGRGGSSKVYKVLDASMRCLALKIVTLEECDAATMEGFINEIKLLRKLQHSNRVVQLIDWEHKESLKRLHIIMELGDTDLSTLMRSYAKVNEVSVSMCKFFWEEMLRCVDVIHREGIIHSDLKPSNFLMVSGRLKLIDFGIASQIQTDCTSVMKDYQLGTFNYISPEAIKSQQVVCNGTSSSVFKISRRSDVWSLGCILYNFVYGHTPFSDIKKVMPKMMAIINADHQIPFPPLGNARLLSDLKACLRRNPYERPTIEQLLTSPYLTN